MKLRTELPHSALKHPFEVTDRTLLLGSCFTEHIGQWLEGLWLNVKCNPWGVLFNPASIAQSITRCLQGGDYQPELTERGGRFYSFDHHSSICADSREALLTQVQKLDAEVGRYLRDTQHLLVTFGTAWVYERQGRVVANCQKAPAAEFQRRMLTVEEIVALWEPLVQRYHVVFTVSPIRHIGDGLHGNQLSKATLLLAIDQLQRRYPEQVEYLPVYELFMDDLRDYRFYADDLVHPSTLAIEAVRELVNDSLFSPSLQRYIKEATPLVKTLSHRPSDPEAEEYRALLEETKAKRAALLQRWGLCDEA